jgi:hypothetical protein
MNRLMHIHYPHLIFDSKRTFLIYETSTSIGDESKTLNYSTETFTVNSWKEACVLGW